VRLNFSVRRRCWIATSMFARANKFVVQSRVHTASGKQRVVCSAFDDATLVQNK